MTRTSDGAPEPVTEHLRGADLCAHAPQSAIPTQGGPPLPPPRSGPFPMGPRIVGPPSAPAQRSPLITPQGRPTPQHPSGEQTPLHDDESVPVKVRLTAWRRQAREVAATPAGRWSLIGAVAVLQVFLLFGSAMWLLGGNSTAVAESKLAPMTWTGIVHDTGPAGVFLRSEARVDPATTKDTAGPGSRLAVSCGQTGDEVRNGTVHTATWLKTTDGLFVSMLYVRVPDRQSIPSCADSTVDAPLLALSDPANPDLPPPPDSTLSGWDGNGTGTARNERGGTDARAAASPRRAAPAQPGLAMPPAAAKAAPAPPATGQVGEGRATSPTKTEAPTTTTTAPAGGSGGVLGPPGPVG